MAAWAVRAEPPPSATRGPNRSSWLAAANGTTAVNNETIASGLTRRFSPIQGRCYLTHIESATLAATMELSHTHGTQQGAALMKHRTKHVEATLDRRKATCEPA